MYIVPVPTCPYDGSAEQQQWDRGFSDGKNGKPPIDNGIYYTSGHKSGRQYTIARETLLGDV
jgi:hypothetical protein